MALLLVPKLGAYLEDGKSLSVWDVFSRVKGRIQNGENADIADDHYHRYMEDIEILHSLGVDAYRFSISWPRILPRGKFGEVNQAGVMFYNKVIDNLLLKGIEPFVTIHHYDFPQELEDRYGGWLSPLMQEDFLHFAETCFKNFGDRVKYWITMNEPNLFGEMAFENGICPPARCSPPFGNCSYGNSDVEPLVASKQGGMIGIAVFATMYRPYTDSRADQEAVYRALAFNLGWILDPLIFGEYPQEMRKYHGNELSTFSPEEQVMLRDSIDFIGINHYTTLYAKDCIHSTCLCNGSICKGSDHAIQGFVYTTGERDGVPIGEPTGQSYVVPEGMEEIVEYIKKRYHNKPMFVTENGYSSPENSDDDDQHDVKRIDYHKSYLKYLARAIRNGGDVRGYFIWTLMDDFEWIYGYNLRFGLYHVDRRHTLNRTPKLSGCWYKDFLIRNSSSLNNIKFDIASLINNNV
ncbi:hypothetical protein RD792_007481 [Penstemon davidsonii]|uniref:Beta-glucosidase n=1 Tax=Penstemon davidsonii TaxID=160366 RepID=A0ABR0D7K9_9LAMI|nr:hypothetical protein RD792_007481 [Penstemon davidsonii]